MSSSSVRRPPARPLAAILAVVAVLFASVCAAAPAYAHYELLATDPVADSVVAEMPEQITLTFSGNLLSEPGATVIEVVDAGGTSLASGDPVVEGPMVTQAIAVEASGTVTVRWKVVYDDGHPGSDEFSFATLSPTATPTSTATPTPTPTPTPSTSPTASPTPAPSPAEPVDLRPWFVGALVLVLLVAGAVLYLLISRARREKALEKARGVGPESDSDAPHDR